MDAAWPHGGIGYLGRIEEIDGKWATVELDSAITVFEQAGAGSGVIRTPACGGRPMRACCGIELTFRGCACRSWRGSESERCIAGCVSGFPESDLTDVVVGFVGGVEVEV